MVIPPFVCWVDGTKKAADLLKTDGRVETAYDVILTLLMHYFLLMIRGEKGIRILACEKENVGRGGAIKIRKGTRSTDWELVPQGYEYLNFESFGLDGRLRCSNDLQ
jgi:hypothetical protein